MKYRADIDGLRAIAVWLVIIFHFNHTEAFNGYIGVDIFFVISGYLITKILMDDLEHNKFSIVTFYERRARRILPILSVVIAITALFGFVLFLPSEQLPFSQSIIATSLFSSNFLFWSEAGYFDVSAALKPLLHTWSLAIEEQFYIIFPILLFAAHRLCKNKLKPIIVVFFLFSFIANVYLIANQEHSTAFYMLHTRAWELLAGSILALNIIRPSKNHQNMQALGWFGALLIILGVFVPIEGDQFPGLFALLPVLGAAAIIYSGQLTQPTHISKLLSHKYLVFMGKISYSLYLWHWPIYVFASYYWINELSKPLTISLMALCVALSYLSWRFIEQPFRQKEAFKKRSTIFVLSFISITVFLAIGSFQFKKLTDEKEFLSSKQSAAKISYENVKHPHYDDTVQIIGNASDFESLDAPTIERSSTIAIWGDSHAKAISPAIAEISRKQNNYSVLLSKNNFLIPSALCEAIKHEKKCIENTDQQLQYLLDHPNIKTVVLAQRWDAWVRQWEKKIKPKTALNLRYASLENIIRALEKSGKQVIILMQVPEITSIPTNQSITSLDLRIERSKRNIDLRPEVKKYHKHTSRIVKIMNDLAEETSAKIIWPHNFLCGSEYCIMKDNGKVLYKDDDHLSFEGAMYTVPFIAPFFGVAPQE